MTLATRPSRVDTDQLTHRIAALRRFLDGVGGHVPADRLAAARTVLDRAGERLALSRDHTVVALAGATGSGKSSLFNAIARLQLSQVGVRRPTTGVAHACVWGSDHAKPLLNWLEVPAGRRFSRESALDGNDEAALRGLVLLDLPDFDSVLDAHRAESDRLLDLVDVVVWVLDPQKYADQVVHEQYLTQFQQHRDITVVVLNQIDRLVPVDADRVVTDLRRLLEADGLPGVPVLTTSATGAPGIDPLRTVLERAVAARQAWLHRLAADVRVAADDLAPLVADEASEGDVDRSSIRRLTDTLADAAGVPAVVAATADAYHHRAKAALGWPLLRWTRRLRPDPLRRLHLSTRSGPNGDDVPSASSLPAPSAAEKAAVALAARSIVDLVARSDTSSRLPDPWPDALLAAARSRLNDVPDALDVAITRSDLGLAERRSWWRVVGALQWIGALVALVGLVWLGLRLGALALDLPALLMPKVGLVPVPTAMLVGGLLFGLLLAVVVRPFIRIGAARAQRSAERKLRNAVTNVATELIVAPVREVLRAYGQARDALASARNS
jgi:GTP-binding protein EngB required for normal cell division